MNEILEVQSSELVHETVQELVLLVGEDAEHILEVPTEHLLLEPAPADVLLEPVETIVLLETAGQGPPGPPGKQGDPGPIGTAAGAFLVDRRLGEIAGDSAAQVEAQANLGLGLVDPLAYYILAKA